MRDNAALSRHPASNEQEPCDPERLKVLEDAMREAIEAYLAYSDPHYRVSRDEFLGRVMEILDRREVGDAAEVGDPLEAAERERARSERTSTQ